MSELSTDNPLHVCFQLTDAAGDVVCRVDGRGVVRDASAALVWGGYGGLALRVGVNVAIALLAAALLRGDPGVDAAQRKAREK